MARLDLTFGVRRRGRARRFAYAGTEVLESRRLLSAGDLDPTFGDGGKVIGAAVAGSTPDFARALLVQPDGKYVVAGAAKGATHADGTDFAVARFNRDGSLDGSFGVGGRTLLDFGARHAAANAVALAPDGGIVVAGQVSTHSGHNLDFTTDFAAARLRPDGSLDASFGDGGTVTVDFHQLPDVAESVLVRPDGRVVLVGEAGVRLEHSMIEPRVVHAFALAQLDPAGRPDPAFGGDGKVTTEIPGTGWSRANDAVLDGQGRVVAAGGAWIPTAGGALAGVDFALARYLPDGALDASFGAGGAVLTSFGGVHSIDETEGLDLLPDGRLVAAGSAWADLHAPTGSDFALARYLPDGQPDPSLDGDGRATYHLGGQHERALDVAAEDSGAAFMAGESDGRVAVLLVLPDGTRDGRFGTNGAVVGGDPPNVLGNGAFHGAALDGDHFVVAGEVRHDFVVARFDRAGNLDPAFGGDGVANVDFVRIGGRGAPSAATSLVVQDDGEVVIGGSALESGLVPGEFLLARLAPDGSLRGTTQVDFGYDRQSVEDLVLQPDGKVVAAGYAVNVHADRGFDDIALARFNRDGSLDRTFGNGGKVTLPVFDGPEQGYERAWAAALQPDGRIVVAGDAYRFSSGHWIAVARLLPDGRPDPTFGGGDGTVLVRPPLPGDESTYVRTFAVAITPDGKVVTGGRRERVALLTRLDADGGLDETFGDGGFVQTGFGIAAEVQDLAVSPNGTITAAGWALPGSSYDFMLVRHLDDGSPDPTFGSGGTVVTDFGAREEIYDMVLRPDGSLVVTGGIATDEYDEHRYDLAVAQYNADGTLDASFGDGGRVTTDFSGSIDRGYGVAQTPDGKIVAAGHAWDPHRRQWDLVAARYEGDAAPAAVVARSVFYNGSALDGGSGEAGAADDHAIDAAKRALLPGQAATAANVTGYSRGINGVMIDVANLPPGAVPGPDDFAFKRAGGGRVAPPSRITVRRGAGAGGSDRVTLVWGDASVAGAAGGAAGTAVVNDWLEVTLRATPRTGLARPDVFAFGNLVGESAAAGRAREMRVDAADVAKMRAVMRTAGLRAPAGALFEALRPLDHNRDGRLDGADLAIVRANLGRGIPVVRGGSIHGRTAVGIRVAWSGTPAERDDAGATALLTET